MKKRIDWIDIARGIGIFLVIAGHTGLPEVFRAWIYSFHMPMFFLISGYLFKVKSQYECFKQSFMSLIRPYLIYSIVFILIDYIIFNDKNYLIDGFFNTIIGRGGFSVLWFFIALFWIQVGFNYIINKFDKIIAIKIIISITIGGYIISLIYLSKFNIYYIITSAITLSFFYIGYWIKIKNVDIYKTFNNILIIFISVIFNLISFYMNYRLFNRRIDLSDAYFGFLPFTYISAITGTYIIVYIAYKLRYKFYIKLIKYIGENTLWYFPLSAYIPKRIVYILEDIYMIRISFFEKIIIILISIIFIAIIIEIWKKRRKIGIIKL